ncbi:metallophosphoesterase [Ammoniphilus sp. CFH 90114]|uniref:metallophosphoesterase n=1 Tax=Ammoniphilus sp. CFH 90114 TaxID=2493665 RepID=UPI00100F8B44|nr:metallophosphoesterase [Ammoniphilus sp. CFH 90114]RXT13609.1 metallophosphoesterase [Ammoniphilus sp. CFH 90114]
MLWIIVLCVFAVILFYAYTNTKRAVFTRITLPVNQAWNGEMKVLHLSDLHMENLSISPEQLYNDLKNEEIDLIALTGDYLDRARSIPKFMEYIKVLKRLPVKHGIYAVFGNHDYVLKKPDFERMKEAMIQEGIHVLINETRKIKHAGKTINIVGIDDHFTRRSDIEEAYNEVTDGVVLVLTHDPNIVLNMKKYHYDYLLSGHFHGGQIHYPRAFHLAKMGKLPRMNMIKGLHFHDEKAFYISEGLGQTGFNIRLRSRPEITLHTLTSSYKNIS